MHPTQLPQSHDDAIGLLEIDGIATALAVQDAALKQADIHFIACAPSTPGKVILLFSGDIASVESSYEVATRQAGSRLIDQLFLPGIAPQVLDIMYHPNPSRAIQGALGTMECNSVAALIQGADIAVKTSQITLHRLHMAQNFGGKGFFTFFGLHADVEAALEASTQHLGVRCLDHVIIAAPDALLEKTVFLRPWPGDPCAQTTPDITS